MTRPLRNLISAVTLAALTGLLVLAGTQWTDVFFRFYPAFSRWILGVLAGVTSVTSFPLWEPGLCLIVLWGIISLIRSLVHHHFLRWLSGLLLTLCGAAFFFMAVWGLNYFAPPMSERLGMETQERTAAELREATGAPVIASAIDAPLIEEPCDEDLSTRGVPCPVDRTVAHGDVVEVGNMKWKVIATPGHTPGSICLFDIPQFGNHPKGLPVLLSGDTLFAGTIGRTDFKGGSMADMRASLKKLAALPDDTAVLPGHNNLTTIGAERRRVFALYGDPE